jgi:undecaprenyl-diphosphatase
MRYEDAIARPPAAHLSIMNEPLTVVWKSVVLGIVEGLTEFLPVSSTGHLILAGHFLRFGTPELEIFIQVGAMLALTWCYRARLLGLLRDLPAEPRARGLVLKVFLAFLPAAVVGLLAHDWIEESLFRPSFVAAMLAVGGVAILLIDRDERSTGLAELEGMTWGQALAIGIGQTLSLLPGMSRSAATIVAGLLAGLDRRAATEFSFLLALPTLYAASLYSLWSARDRIDGDLVLAMAVGLIAAYLSALVVINAFLRYVQTNTLRPFGWYRIAVGAALLYWLG